MQWHSSKASSPGNRDRPYRAGRSDWIKVKNPDAPAATRLIDGRGRPMTRTICMALAFALILSAAPARSQRLENSVRLENLDGVKEVMLTVSALAAEGGCKTLKDRELVTAAQFTANQSTRLRFVSFEDFWKKALAAHERNPTPLEAQLRISLTALTVGNACIVNVDARLTRDVEGGHFYDGKPNGGKSQQLVWSDSVLLYAPLMRIESYTEHAIDNFIKRVVNLWVSSQSSQP
jgi:hypothetical protein